MNKNNKSEILEFARAGFGLEDFKDRPISMIQKSNDLAKTSYCYTGQGYIIKCFHCGTLLKKLCHAHITNVNQLHEAVFENYEFLMVYRYYFGQIKQIIILCVRSYLSKEKKVVVGKTSCFFLFFQ